MCFSASQHEFTRVGLNEFGAFYDQINSCSESFTYVLSVSMFVDAYWCVIMRLKRFTKLFNVSQQHSSRSSVFEVRCTSMLGVFTHCRTCSRDVGPPSRVCEYIFVRIHLIRLPTVFRPTGSPCTLWLCVASVQYEILCRS